MRVVACVIVVFKGQGADSERTVRFTVVLEYALGLHSALLQQVRGLDYRVSEPLFLYLNFLNTLEFEVLVYASFEIWVVRAVFYGVTFLLTALASQKFNISLGK